MITFPEAASGARPVGPALPSELAFNRPARDAQANGAAKTTTATTTMPR